MARAWRSLSPGNWRAFLLLALRKPCDWCWRGFSCARHNEFVVVQGAGTRLARGLFDVATTASLLCFTEHNGPSRVIGR